jgi:hypothetical protein
VCGNEGEQRNGAQETRVKHLEKDKDQIFASRLQGILGKNRAR